MDWTIPPQPARALALLREGGYEAWIVGGCVRDHLLGRPPQDYDITTSARPEQTKAVFSACRTIDTGLRHGTVTVLLDGCPLEITTYRLDGAYSDGRHPDQVTFTASLREDAARRDFTMNAMAWAPGEGLRDFFGGAADVQSAIIRAVGEPDVRFQEDPLRILRALRFASVLGFSLENATREAARRQRGLLKRVSPERLWAELAKLLLGKNVGDILQAYPDILGEIIPELLPMVGFDQRNAHHCYDLFTHTAVAVAHVPPVLSLRLAMLLHDVGKPETFALGPDGQGHFYGHARRGVELARDILRRLRLPRRLEEETLTLIRYHDSVIEEAPQRIARWLNRLGPEGFFALLDIQRGDAAGQGPAFRGRLARADRIEAMARDLLAQKPCLTLKELAVNGRDLTALGLRGPEVGWALARLLDQVIEGRLPNDPAPLLQYIERKAAKMDPTEPPQPTAETGGKEGKNVPT